ncbi:MAG: gamma-glutamyl-gamma-aminobutyrate hydrolase family protein [Solirubrobacterales bacterium]
MSRPPLIGITTYEEPASWSHWRETRAVLVPTAYVEGVHRAGGVPLLLAPLPEAGRDVDAIVARLDGLVLIGGGDLSPVHYGAEPNYDGLWQEARDRFELELLRAALDRDLPFLGICRGMQLLNVVRGGTLHQDLGGIVADPTRHRAGLGVFTRHEVEVEPDSKLHDLLGSRPDIVSSHHQVADRIGEGLRVVARDPDDPIAEAIEDPSRRFCLGVQWHPEEDPDGTASALFGELVRAAGAVASGAEEIEDESEGRSVAWS